MGRHFISILGTGNYNRTVYCCEEGRFETAYIQEALLKLKLGELKEGDRITIFVTKESREENWENRAHNARERKLAEERGETLPELHQGLREILEREYGPYLDDIEKCVIPFGANEEELWAIFQTIYDCIDREDELYIDITHAMRNIPIMMLSVIEFARTVKNVTAGGIYYGAFEAGKANDQGIKEAPIFDLITFLDILDWSQAAASFVKYGSSDQITDLFKENKKRISRQSMESGGTDPMKMRELQGVVMELQNITRGLETSRGYCDINEIKRKGESSGQSSGLSVLESYYAYKEYYKELQAKDKEQSEAREQQKGVIIPLGELMEVIDDKVRVFDVESNLELGLAAVEWAIRHKRTQQGFTALNESITTFLCVCYASAGLNEDRWQDRELCKSVCNQLAKYITEKRVRELTDEDRMSAFEDWKKYARSGSEEQHEMARAVMMSVPKELVDIGREISRCRNSMNHFGYSSNSDFKGKFLEMKLTKYYDDFRVCMRQMEGRGEHE